LQHWHRESYWYWIRFYLRFHQMRHPLELGPSEVNQFLSWLASERQVAAAAVSNGANDGCEYGYIWRRSLPRGWRSATYVDRERSPVLRRDSSPGARSTDLKQQRRPKAPLFTATNISATCRVQPP